MIVSPTRASLQCTKPSQYRCSVRNWSALGMLWVCNGTTNSVTSEFTVPYQNLQYTLSTRILTCISSVRVTRVDRLCLGMVECLGWWFSGNLTRCEHWFLLYSGPSYTKTINKHLHQSPWHQNNHQNTNFYTYFRHLNLAVIEVCLGVMHLLGGILIVQNIV